jgi:hypothetical protein
MLLTDETIEEAHEELSALIENKIPKGVVTALINRDDDAALTDLSFDLTTALIDRLREYDRSIRTFQ